MASPGKNYYDLLSVPPSADTAQIKAAFRREIARYHPDKVIHLGPEFQEMAATRAAELTVAYKTLTEAGLRADYDQSLAIGAPAPAAAPEPPAEPPPATPAPVAEEAFAPPPGSTGRQRFEPERANRDIILRRAIVGRVQASVEAAYGAVQTPAVKGFDAAFVPSARPRLLSAPLPRVLLKAFDVVDTAAVNEAWTGAARARVHAGKSPVVVLLCGQRVAPQHELLKAIQAMSRQPRGAEAPHEIVVVAVDTADWTCRLPPDVSPAVRKLVDQLRA